MHFAYREIVEKERQPFGYIRIRLLLHRQGDIEAYALAARLKRAAVCGLHNAWPAAGDNGKAAAAFLDGYIAELARLAVIFG